MIHGPCHVKPESAPCIDAKTKQCSKNFPKKFRETTSSASNGYPEYKRPNNGRTVTVNGVQLDNRSVIPYNIHLSKLFNCHINVEICNSVTSVKYLYKYVNKGHDAALAELSTDKHDEIKQYVNSRYVSTSEAFWRIYGFDLHNESPSILRLAVHLEGEQNVVFNEEKDLSETLAKNNNSTLTSI